MSKCLKSTCNGLSNPGSYQRRQRPVCYQLSCGSDLPCAPNQRTTGMGGCFWGAAGRSLTQNHPIPLDTLPPCSPWLCFWCCPP